VYVFLLFMPANRPYGHFQIKNLIENREYLFPRNTVKTVNNACHIFFFRGIFSNALARLKRKTYQVF